MKYLHFMSNAVRLWTKLEISFGVFFFADSNAILIRSYNCYIQRLYVFNRIRIQVTGWQFIYVGWCFIIFFYKNIFSFLKRINRYSYVPTKHYFLPTTIPLHLNFLLMSASYIWSDSRTRKGLLFTTTLIVFEL